MRKRLITAAVLPMLVAACGDAPTELGPTESVTTHAAVSAAVTPAGMTEGVEDLVLAQEAAWAAKDAAAYAATYTEDAELVNPVAGILVGRAGILAGHAFLFNPATGPFRASTSSLTVRDIVFLSGTVALVKLDVTLTGFSGLPPGLPAVEPGVVRTRVSWIAVRQGPQWQIMYQQMTPHPAP